MNVNNIDDYRTFCGLFGDGEVKCFTVPGLMKKFGCSYDEARNLVKKAVDGHWAEHSKGLEFTLLTMEEYRDRIIQERDKKREASRTEEEGQETDFRAMNIAGMVEEYLENARHASIPQIQKQCGLGYEEARSAVEYLLKGKVISRYGAMEYCTGRPEDITGPDTWNGIQAQIKSYIPQIKKLQAVLRVKEHNICPADKMEEDAMDKYDKWSILFPTDYCGKYPDAWARERRHYNWVDYYEEYATPTDEEEENFDEGYEDYDAEENEESFRYDDVYFETILEASGSLRQCLQDICEYLRKKFSGSDNYSDLLQGFCVKVMANCELVNEEFQPVEELLERAECDDDYSDANTAARNVLRCCMEIDKQCGRLMNMLSGLVNSEPKSHSFNSSNK